MFELCLVVKGETKQTAGAAPAAAAAATAAVPIEPRGALVSLLPAGGLCTRKASQLHINLSQLAGQDLNPSSILSLYRFPSK